MRVLVTGGCGFLGAHIVEHLLKNTLWEIIVLDRLSYASFGFDRLRDIQAYDDSRVIRFTHEIASLSSYLAVTRVTLTTPFYF